MPLCKTCARFCSKRINIKKFKLIVFAMIKNTSDFNKQRIEELKKKFTLKDAMKFRSNIRFYKQDDIPSRKVIEEIIQDAHDLIPHKNNMIECNIKILCPEFAKEKEDLVHLQCVNHKRILRMQPTRTRL